MVMKKILLTLFTTLASLGILANNLLPVSAPTLADEPIELSRAAGRAQKANGHSFAQTPVNQIQGTESGTTASAPASVIATVQEPAVVESTPVTGSDIAAAPLATLELINQPGRMLVSDWLDVPTAVMNRVSALNAPVFQPVAEIPRAETEQVVTAQETFTPDAKSHTTLVAAWIETPAVIFDQIRFIPVSEEPFSAKTFIGTPERRVAIAAPAKPTVTPSAIFDAIRFLPVSESPIILVGTPEQRVTFRTRCAGAERVCDLRFN